MSIRRGNSVIASSNSNGLQMFDMKWSDHTIDDLNWISSHSNSYHSGNTYKKMYNHLVEDYNNGVIETEVIGSYTISYKLASDGHKIVDTVSSSIIDNIYDSTGVAWYYVLDKTNQRFKLPRTKHGFVGLRDGVGKFVEQSLPNITGSVAGAPSSEASGAFVDNGATSTAKMGGGNYTAHIFGFDASRSSSAYQDNAPVQERATQMLLYFYTNQFSVNSSSSGGSGSITITYDSTNKRLIFGE